MGSRQHNPVNAAYCCMYFGLWLAYDANEYICVSLKLVDQFCGLSVGSFINSLSSALEKIKNE